MTGWAYWTGCSAEKRIPLWIRKRKRLLQRCRPPSHSRHLHLRQRKKKNPCCKTHRNIPMMLLPSETDITDTEIILEEPDSQPFDSSSSVSVPPLPQRTWDDVTQRKLDRYFNRLRELYPDGVITRLNTGHKKLAERGAQLRSLLGMEGELDNFFALGGFTYCRTGGGRPPLPLTDADCERIHAHIRQLFPEGVPVVMAIRDADHRLYLDLRAVARREGKKLADLSAGKRADVTEKSSGKRYRSLIRRMMTRLS